MGSTWEKFSSLPAKKRQKFETATGKENQILDTALFTHVFSKDIISIAILLKQVCIPLKECS